MSLTTSAITGRIPLPTNVPAIRVEVTFTLTGYDTQGENVVPGGAQAKFVAEPDGTLPPGASLWRNTQGLRGTVYHVGVTWQEGSRRDYGEKYADLGYVQVGDNPSYTLPELLANPAQPQPGWYETVPAEVWQDILGLSGQVSNLATQTSQNTAAIAGKADQSALAATGFEQAALVTDFDAISKSGQYRGSSATGAPVAIQQFVVQHIEGLAGRAWQVALQQRSTTGDPSREYRRYRDPEGVWEPWVEVMGAHQVATAAQGVRADRALQPAAGDPIYLFSDGSGGAVYDFTDTARLGVSQIPNVISGVDDLLGGPRLVPSGSAPEAALSAGRVTLRSAVDGDQLNRASEPLLPESSDFLLAWSQKSDNTNMQAMIWQHAVGAEGRTNITANARFNGAVSVAAPGWMQVLMAGVVDGSGLGGMIAPAAHPVGQWADFILIIRAGEKQSEFWRDGILIDRFTRPSSIPQITTTLFRHPSRPGAGQTMGRVMCIHRAPAPGEISLIRTWLRESFAENAGGSGLQWADPTITSPAAAIRPKPIPGLDVDNIWDKAGDTQLRPASLTKLMTAHTGLVWLKRLDAMDTLFERQAGDSNAGSGANLNVGDTIDVPNALANLGLPSSNVTANVWGRVIGDLIAGDQGGSGGVARFVDEMNAEAARIGMSGSTWANPSGLDQTGHLSTAKDMTLLCERAGLLHPEITTIWALASWDLQITGPDPRVVGITHSVDFIQNEDPRVSWGKTGTTPLGGNCLLCEFKAPKGNRFYYVGLGATSDTNRYTDANAVYSAAETGVDWPSLFPQRRS